MKQQIIDVKQQLPSRVIQVGKKSEDLPNNTLPTKPFYILVPDTLQAIFQKKANLYFLLVSIIQVCTWERIGWLHPSISPTGPWGTALPLLGTIALQFLVFFGQWASQWWTSRCENTTTTTIIDWDRQKSQKEESVVHQQDLKPGMVVQFKNGDKISVDIITLQTTFQDGQQLVATFSATSLTGEPGNIITKVPDEHISLEDVLKENMKIDIYPSSCNLNDFSGTLYAHGTTGTKPIPLNANNTIPAGAILTSSQVIGVAYATGPDRKMQLKPDATGIKSGVLDQLINIFMIYNVYVLAVMVCVCSVLSMQFDPLTDQEKDWYGRGAILVRLVQNFMIYNGMIPLSLSINLQIIRSLQAVFSFQMNKISVNRHLEDDLNGTEYIFSDKTGTLTRNEMTFSYLVDSTGPEDLVFRVEENPIHKHQGSMTMLRCLGLCTTARPFLRDQSDLKSSAKKTIK